MTAINFPDNPAVGDIYSISTRSWRWTGSFWASSEPSTTQNEVIDSGDINGDIFIIGGNPYTVEWDKVLDAGSL
jgi:hypothetical protein